VSLPSILHKADFFLDNIHLQRESRKAQIMLLADYFPYGMQMPGRSYNSTQYRYGFGGMEKDDEIAGSGNPRSRGCLHQWHLW
jgi:hypothetical protein